MYCSKYCFSGVKTLVFVLLLSVVSGLTLSLVVQGLQQKKIQAKELDISQQLLISAKVYSPQGYFLLPDGNEYVPAKREGNALIVDRSHTTASSEDVLSVYSRRVRPMLVSRTGSLVSYQKVGIEPEQFLKEWKSSAQSLPYLPIYEVLNDQGSAVESYVIPVQGLGLWDRIFGYLAVFPDGITVKGISWYEHKETPGLGGTIAEPSWQQQFFLKKIFLPDEQGKVDVADSPLGITVVKGKVNDVLGNSPTAKNAVDGIAGATLTGQGVTRAFKDCLEPYRPFLMSLSSKKQESVGGTKVGS